jgi:antitoxin (DNA-binding transcriptional repressor) of toxin-antitoxin stability system
MATRTIDILGTQPPLSELLELARAGDEVVIVEGDRPLARLVPVAQGVNERIAGLHRGAIWTSDDFDAPLPDEFWTGPA